MCILALCSNLAQPTMSLFGTNAGFGTGGTSVFGSTTTDTHNPMKVNYAQPQPDSFQSNLNFVTD